jgi:hypothetical protein
MSIDGQWLHLIFLVLCAQLGVLLAIAARLYRNRRD